MRRPRSKLELTLFPFLSVLLGLIAVLILQLYVVQLGRTNAEAASATKIRAETEKAGFERDETGRLNAEIARLIHQINQSLTDLATLRTQREDAHERLAADPLASAVADLLTRLPNLSGKEPIPVVVTAESFIVNPHLAERKEFEIQTESQRGRTKFKMDPSFFEFLRSIDEHHSERYIMFFVRSDGVQAFRAITDYCDQTFPTIKNPNRKPDAGPADTFDIGKTPFSPNPRRAQQ